ncbi:MAG: hypothetical protein IT305_18655 [Chloroflexi bacterium]|nr:hypothetical protein [Chloroflexota bacterium]
MTDEMTPRQRVQSQRPPGLIRSPERPALRIEPAAWEKLWRYIQLAEGEVGGLGAVVQDGPDFVMTECFLIDQRATDVDTELDPEAASRFLLDYALTDADPSALRLWWHSHAHESCFWSPDDERTIDRWGGEWLVALVGNFRGKFLARFDRYEPRRETVGWLDVLPPGPPPSLDGPEAEAVRADLARMVRVVRRTTTKLWTDGDLPKRHG